MKIQPPQLVRRLQADGVFSLQIAKTAIATSLAFELGRVTSSPYPVFAALAALLVVQVTVYDSVNRGLQRVGGVLVGVLVAYGIARVVGLHAWSLGLVVLLALMVGKLLRLGDSGAVQVPVSALLVLTVGTSNRYAVDRILETVIGAAVGIVVNVALAPPTRTDDAGRTVAELGERLAAVLAEAGRGLADPEWAGSAARWMSDARLAGDAVAAAESVVQRAETSLRLNPRGARLIPVARRRRLALRAMEHVAVQVRGICRALQDAAEHPDPDQPQRAPARQALGLALAAAAGALVSYGTVALEPDAHATSAEVEALKRALRAAREAVDAAAEAARAVPSWDRVGWLVYGSLLTDANRILDELDGAAQVELLATAAPVPRRRR